jgi:hypothetical protein
LLDEHSTKHAPLPVTSDPLPSLLEQCQQACAEISAREPEPIRTIHHFACTGGTLICKQLAVMPNTYVLSEVDPLSLMARDISFAPSDLVHQLRMGIRDVDDQLLVKTFIAGLQVIYDWACNHGARLVLRDHTHSQFCWGADIRKGTSLIELLQDDFQIRGAVTVRHPLDSYLSLDRLNWASFTPKTFEEYCRRYLAFLEIYQTSPLFKYEDFVADPETVTQAICTALALPFDAGFTDISSLVHLSGDSGRTGGRISARPRREIPERIAQECQNSKSYWLLCQRLDYEP